ncbi:MAG: zinc carboxypeptidase [Bacteroidetes bacterium]|nr:zinc carboxypeptidase [Bacteroidota bacterium]
MKTLYKIIFFTFLFNSAFAQQEKYSRVKVWLTNKNITELASLGIDVTEGDHRPGVWFITEMSQSELNRLKQASFKTDVIVDDVKAFRIQQKPSPKRTAAFPCATSSAPDYPQPQNFTLGSMGGFFTYQEMLDMLDSMASKYPNLITVKQPINALTTNDGNQLLWVKISDNPNTNETEPEVLYSALHHAREPAGLSNLIYYMWYLLENYSTITEIQSLVDNTEMYFVPCVNPDGYQYNELTDPLGGGFWRKNRLDNLDGTFGVDPNRNYGYNWGFDDTGSSPFTGDETYRGTNPFSEVENQTMQDFCNAHEFKLAFNYHTFGNLLIYPWGYIPDFYTPDSALLVNYGSL